MPRLERLVWRTFTVRFRSRDPGPWTIHKIGAGVPTVRKVTPAAGDSYAYEVVEYPRNIEVAVSPSGRSVRVYVDGLEVAAPDKRDE